MNNALWAGCLMAAITGCTTHDLEPTTTSTEQALTADTLPLPFRQSDLATGQLYGSTNDHGGNGRDFNAFRNDPDMGWTRLREDVTLAQWVANPQNDHLIVFGKPIYSPVSGTVFSCWRNAPENLNPEVSETQPAIQHPWRIPVPVEEGGDGLRHIIGGGNHLLIETDDNRVVLIAHMMAGSVASHLCPNNAAWVQDGDAMIDETPIYSMIPEANRPRVTVGEFVGRVGNTGRSSGPHLHLHVKPIEGYVTSNGITVPAVGVGIPMLFHGGFKNGAPLLDETIDDGDRFYASPFLRDGEVFEAQVQETVSTATSGFTVTAVRDLANNLRIRSYDGVTLKDEEVYGAASQLAITALGENGFVVAFKDANGNLKLIQFFVSVSGAIIRRGEAGAGSVSRIAMTAVPTGTGVATAIRDSNDQLKVITWHVDYTNSSITRVDDAAFGSASEVSMATLTNPFDGVAVAVRDMTGKLRIDTFAITPALVVGHTTSIAEGQIKNVDADAILLNGSNQLVVAARDTANNLQLFNYYVSGSGIVHRRGTATAGAISALDVQATLGTDVATGVVDGSGNLRLISWRVFADRIERHGEIIGGPALDVSLTSVVGGSLGTSLRTANNTHEVIAWQFAN